MDECQTHQRVTIALLDNWWYHFLLNLDEMVIDLVIIRQSFLHISLRCECSTLVLSIYHLCQLPIFTNDTYHNLLYLKIHLIFVIDRQANQYLSQFIDTNRVYFKDVKDICLLRGQMFHVIVIRIGGDSEI